MLKIVYRTTSAAYDIAGLQPIDIQHSRLINIDLSATINGFFSFPSLFLCSHNIYYDHHIKTRGP